eukprot:SAG31_NODE_8118_length_1519_cov_1.067606_1_plen_79_part_10
MATLRVRYKMMAQSFPTPTLPGLSARTMKATRSQRQLPRRTLPVPSAFCYSFGCRRSSNSALRSATAVVCSCPISSIGR